MLPWARIAIDVGSAEQDIQLPTQIWVHLTYQTAFADNAGRLQMRRDIYNLDSRTLAAIRSERGPVEGAPERKRDPEMASGAGANRPVRPARTAAQSTPFQAPSYVPPLAFQPIYR